MLPIFRRICHGCGIPTLSLLHSFSPADVSTTSSSNSERRGICPTASNLSMERHTVKCTTQVFCVLNEIHVSVYWPLPPRSGWESTVANGCVLICQRENEHRISALGCIMSFIILPLETKYRKVDFQHSNGVPGKNADQLRKWDIALNELTNAYKFLWNFPQATRQNHLNYIKMHNFAMSDSLNKMITLQGLLKLSNLISITK